MRTYQEGVLSERQACMLDAAKLGLMIFFMIKCATSSEAHYFKRLDEYLEL